MSLATFGDDGLWSAAIFYVNLELALYFLSAGHTRHARNMDTRPQVAATIQEDYRGWQEIKGIQLSGAVVKLEGSAQEEAIRLYRHKFPFAFDAPRLREAILRVNWYRLDPENLYFVDNSRGFGHRDEISLAESGR
jgi:uncharacterized protein YhbP (UPF0306 family)